MMYYLGRRIICKKVTIVCQELPGESSEISDLMQLVLVYGHLKEKLQVLVSDPIARLWICSSDLRSSQKPMVIQVLFSRTAVVLILQLKSARVAAI